MATMFGRFEIQSELSKSDTALIYKAMDTEANQVVALKTQTLAPLGDRAEAFVETLIAEGESTRELVGQNIVMLYGAGEIDGQFCAAMEYIQGNSVATMLARKEGFSIWDLLDITRQVCAGLEQAAAKGVTHCSLEPAKIMVQWDGMVKILGYGISNMGLIGSRLTVLRNRFAAKPSTCVRTCLLWARSSTRWWLARRLLMARIRLRWQARLRMRCPPALRR